MTANSADLTLPDEAATASLGERLAKALRVLPAVPMVIYLQGELGAGKSALARSLLRALGVTGSIRSPTYTLLEQYEAGGWSVIHLDLYRLGSPLELEALGLRDLLEPRSLWLVEWPQKGAGGLPPADITVQLDFMEPGRKASLRVYSPVGQQLLDELERTSVRL